MEKDWVVLKLGFRKVWVVLKLGFRVALRGPEFRAWILTLESKISGVEKLGSTSVFFLFSGFTRVAWKPVGELYWVMLEWVLNDPAVPLLPFLPCIRSMCRIDWGFLARGTLLGNVGVGVQWPACALSPRSLPFHSRSLRSLLLLGSWMGFAGISD
jgi:hypothetical protein